MDQENHEMFSAISFVLLHAKEMSIFQLIEVLFWKQLQKTNFIHSHGSGLEESDKHKWLVLASLSGQKFLQVIDYLLKCLGHTIEYLLNLFSGNFNVFMVLLNLLRGKDIMSHSGNYKSIIGHLEKRVDLDGNITREDPRYNPALSIMASKASYENKACIQAIVTDHWGMELVECGDYWNNFQEKATTQAFVLLDRSEDHDTYVVAFRGTEPFDADAWSTDIDFSWLKLPNMGNAHAGFMKALGLRKKSETNHPFWPKEIEKNEKDKREAYYAIRDLLKRHLHGNDKARFIVTGHSLGGALAILFPSILLLHNEESLLKRLEGVYTFGQPRVGDERFAKYMKKGLEKYRIKYYRYAYSNDIVPRLPMDDKNFLFKHFGTCLYFDTAYIGQELKEEPNKNFFSLSEMIPMRVDAFRELVRSFTIVYYYGDEYKEGLFLKIFRVLGLIVPGIPPHIPQDYVNVTRVGRIHLHED